MIKIDQEFLSRLSEEAKHSKRLRKNHNFHNSDADTMHRMLNAIEPNSYIRPHKHENPDKREAFFALHGRILILEFNNNGNIRDHIILDSREGHYGTEIAPRTWHSMISLETGSVAYEVKDGPYDPMTDKIFASWAPEEGSAEAIPYMQEILKHLKLI